MQSRGRIISGDVKARSTLSALTADVEVAADTPDHFQPLATTVHQVGRGDALQGTRSFTVFSPPDEGSTKLTIAPLEALRRDNHKLSAVRAYHLGLRRLKAVQVTLGVVETAPGQSLRVSAKNGALLTDSAMAVKTDRAAFNGVFYVIDIVVLPQ